jgi:hypothetical protein
MTTYILILILNGVPDYLGSYSTLKDCIASDKAINTAIAEKSDIKLNTRCLKL